MVDSIKTPLFKTIEEKIAMKINNDDKDKEAIRNLSSNIILEESLTRIALLTRKITLPTSPQFIYKLYNLGFYLVLLRRICPSSTQPKLPNARSVKRPL
jgi:hypothetical protein